VRTVEIERGSAGSVIGVPPCGNTIGGLRLSRCLAAD
jgi:hypothetical protein